jgi:hypothetical protein
MLFLFESEETMYMLFGEFAFAQCIYTNGRIHRRDHDIDLTGFHSLVSVLATGGAAKAIFTHRGLSIATR